MNCMGLIALTMQLYPYIVTELLARAECWKLVEPDKRKEEQEVAMPLAVPELAWSKG